MAARRVKLRFTTSPLIVSCLDYVSHEEGVSTARWIESAVIDHLAQYMGECVYYEALKVEIARRQKKPKKNRYRLRKKPANPLSELALKAELRGLKSNVEIMKKRVESRRKTKQKDED